MNKNHDALAYRQAGKIHWYVEPKRSLAKVIQIGRFSFNGQDDEPFWKDNLSNANPRARRYENRTFLLFDLNTKSDFQFFQDRMEKDAAAFKWKTAGEEDQGEVPEIAAAGQ
jgi:hypothetical protein